MDAWTVRIEFAPVRRVFWEVLFFRDEVDDVETESFDSFLTPEPHHLVDILAHLFILPVQVGLGHIEQVEIILPALLIIFPRVSAELRFPVRRFVAPDVVITVPLVSRQ